MSLVSFWWGEVLIFSLLEFFLNNRRQIERYKIFTMGVSMSLLFLYDSLTIILTVVFLMGIGFIFNISKIKYFIQFYRDRMAVLLGLIPMTTPAVIPYVVVHLVGKHYTKYPVRTLQLMGIAFSLVTHVAFRMF